MPQIFHPAFNTLSKVSLAGAGLVLAGVTGALYVVGWSPYVTQEHVARVQPVPFSHAHHVGQLGIDCRFCHTTVEESAFAGMPPTKTCMNCHQEIWFGSDVLEPIRASYRSGRSIEWQRIHNLPQFVYFNHAIHVNKGIGCVSCHGRVDQMAFTYQDQSLLMRWCLECHRAPQAHLRPREDVTHMSAPLADPTMQGSLAQRYHMRSTQEMTSCSTCHR
jgi:hypothetical protein